MGFYVQISCDDSSCRFEARIGNATEFYVDGQGNEMPYGHTSPLSQEAAERGIAGYWRDLLCWDCGRLVRDSVKLDKPCRDSIVAWSMFPPARLDDHPRTCRDCQGLLCDVESLHMFLTYRADPNVVTASLRAQLSMLRDMQTKRRKKQDDWWDRARAELLGEIVEPPDVPIRRVEAELRALEDVRSEEEMILHRLGLVPEFPVSRASITALATKLTSACEALARSRADFLAKLEAAIKTDQCAQGAGSPNRTLAGDRSSQGGDVVFDLLRSPPMKAKRAADAQAEEMRGLLTHMWIAKRLAVDEKGTLETFRQRCPKCRAVPLDVSSFQT